MFRVVEVIALGVSQCDLPDGVEMSFIVCKMEING
jgi:hypothetical protein